MPTTRSSTRNNSEITVDEQKKNQISQSAGSKRKQLTKQERINETTKQNQYEQSHEPGASEESGIPQKRRAQGQNPPDTAEDSQPQPPTKAAKHDDSSVDSKSAEATSSSPAINKSKLEKLLNTYGTLQLSSSNLHDPDSPTPSTILAHLLHALLTSARISHSLATKTLECLLEANYHDLNTLRKSTWEERTEMLTKGGYTRYREKTATTLGELAEVVVERYEGDLNKLREVAGDDVAKVRKLIGEFKGVGEVGVGIFHDTIQAIWPFMAPYLDPRNHDTAVEVGLSKDVQAMWEAVGKNPKEMARLCAALTAVRLEKKLGEFKNQDDGEERGQADDRDAE